MTVFEGEVADNYDPENWGRLKIHIYGRTEDMSPDDLPFARVNRPVEDSLALSDKVVEVGTRIWGFIFNNDYNQIMIMGQLKKVSQTY